MKIPVILVMCGSSIATSTLAATKIEQEAKKRGVQVTVKKGKISDADRLVKSTNADLIVATAVCKQREDVPVLSGVPLITGVGQAALYDQIFDVVKKAAEA